MISHLNVPPVIELYRQLFWSTSRLAGARTSVQKYIPSRSYISFVNLGRLTGTSVITKSGEQMKMLGSMVYPAGEGNLFIETSGGSSCLGALVISIFL